MLQQFKNMNELVQYLGALEERVRILEEENQKLRAAPAAAPVGANHAEERAIAKMVASFLPLTNIVHPRFLRRAFAVWGHFFVANLIISIPFTALYFCLLTTILRSGIQNP